MNLQHALSKSCRIVPVEAFSLNENDFVLLKITRPGNTGRFFYMDSRMNKWDSSLFTEERAVDASRSLVDCYDCVNCQDCKNCTLCIRCNTCEYCTGCIECKLCSHCEGCLDCFDCRQCKECIDCNRCEACSKCVTCSLCKNCALGVSSRNVTPVLEETIYGPVKLSDVKGRPWLTVLFEQFVYSEIEDGNVCSNSDSFLETDTPVFVTPFVKLSKFFAEALKKTKTKPPKIVDQ